MALTPLNVDRVKIVLNDTIVQGYSSVNMSLQNESFTAENTSLNSHFRDLSKKSIPNLSFSKIASTYDFSTTILGDFMSRDTLTNVKVISESYGLQKIGVECSEAAIDDINISISSNEFISLSYSCTADRVEKFSRKDLSISEAPINYEVPQVSAVTGFENNMMTSDMFDLSCSIPALEFVGKASLSISNKKSVIGGLIAPNKKIWTGSNIYTLRISVNDINKFITQNPTEVAEASFTLKFYYDEDQAHEFITFQLDNCVLKEYSEGIGEKTSSEMNLTYVFVDSSRSAMTLTSPPSFSPI